MAYKCLECGHIFEEGEQVEWEETHGLSCPPYEIWTGCPICKGGYEETKKCKICDRDFLEDELYDGCICDECIEEYSKDFDTCYKIADTEKEEVKINALLASMFDAAEIEQILYEWAKKPFFAEQIKKDCSSFIEQDKEWFAERLSEEVIK